ncbi:MAG: alpha-2-macroglobulin, partial [Blastocatellia bacterium]|nr:alpha-2-macroglobulin [Blastocatellia bacterium]
MKQLITLLFLSFLCLAGPQPQQPSYDTIKTEAERLYAEASYSQARELYLKARAIKLPPEEADWVDFRLADTLWRAQAATQNADTTRFDTARQQLEALSSERRRSEIRDIIWAEAQESLGDFWWARGDARDWNRAFTHYQQALDWWAGTKDLELGTTRYLKIVWKMAHPHGGNHYYRYGDYGTYLPLEILDNALKISRSETDRAHAHYLIAKTLRNLGGDFRLQQRVPEEFEAALAIGKTSEWYDDALYHYALWMEQVGRYIQDDRGNTRTDQDYVKALGLFRRLITEYKKGETPYYDEATHQIENITKPAVNVSASNVFLPDSEVQFQLSWRNTKKVGLALYPVNLTRDFRLTAKPSGAGTWSQIDISGIKALKTWDKEINDKGDYRPGDEMIVLDRKLPVGAYLIEAKIGGLIARDLLLVTDAALVVKASGKQAIAYFCNALSGAPLANAGVKLAEHYYNGKEYFWRESTKFTDREGMASFDLIDSSNNIQLIAVAESDNRQAFSNGSSYGNYREQQPWSIYAYTDRPAYRPNEVAHWKFTARKYQGSVYSTPAQQTIEFSIFDPRGTTVKEGKVELNAFGSAWGEMELTESMPLGQYQIDFYDVGRKRSIGNAA